VDRTYRGILGATGVGVATAEEGPRLGLAEGPLWEIVALLE
jgi:hypothetical protein